MDTDTLTKSRQNLRNKLYLTIFISILILLVVTPLGFIQFGVIKLTLVHIPVILSSIIFGPRLGLITGLLFAISSLVVNTLTPGVLSFAFSPFIPVYGSEQGCAFALLVCFLPRILLGIVPGYLAYKYERKFTNKHFFNGTLAIISSGIHTSVTLLLLGLFFAMPIASLNSIDIDQAWLLLGSLCLSNGIPEAIAAGFVCSIAAPILRKKVK